MVYSKMLRCFVCLLFYSYVSLNAQIQPDTIIVTYRDFALKKKAQPTGRLQFGFMPSVNKYILAANNFDKLPRYFKRLRIREANTNNTVSFSRKDAFEFAIPLLESQVDELLADTLISSSSAISRARKLKNYQESTNRYFGGKSAGIFFKDNWIPLIEFKPNDNNNQLTLQLRKAFSTKVICRTDKLPIGFAPQFPSIDNPNCGPIDRFYRLKKMNGYGLEKFKYQTYQPTERQIIREEIEVYFDKNSSDAKQEDVQKVIDYLRNNNYSIINASIEGYTSLEGEEKRNNNLQIKRANVLINVLQRYNNEPIKLDTVIVRPAHEQFRENILDTPYKWLDSLSNESIRLLLNTNNKLVISVEPYLKTQRRAVLKLAMAKRLNSFEIFERFKSDFRRWENKLNPKLIGDKGPQEVEARVMGMIDYLYSLLKAGTISLEEFTEVIEQAKSREVLKVLIVYHELIEFEKGVIADSLNKTAYFKKYKFDDMLNAGHKSLVELIRNKDYKQYQDKFKRQLVDMQSYLFELVQKGWLPVDALCAVSYPEDYLFWGFILNKLAFLQYLTVYMEVPCETMRAEPWLVYKKYNDNWLDEVQTNRIQNNGIAYRPTEKYAPSHAISTKSPFLYYLKILYIKNKGSVAPYISLSDDFREFDLYTLAQYHVSRWNPFINYYADHEVQLMEMDKVIKQLKTAQRLICPRSTNELYLDYHLKALHYMSVYYEPGNALHTDIVQQSLKFIGNYYAKYAESITPRLSLYILHQLNAFHWMPGKYEGTWYARNILISIRTNRELTTDENFLYEKYRTFYR
jgi:hypothetical protein